MSLTTCTIHVASRQERVVYVSGDLAKALKLAKSRSITLKLGSKSISLGLKLLKKSGNHLYLTPSVYSQLRLPRAGTTLVTSSNGRELRLGPMIGILTSVVRGSSAPFGSRTEFIRQFMRVGADRAFYFGFSPGDVNWTQGTITATVPRSEGGWVRKVVPLPDVVYNRLPSRKAEKLASNNAFKQRFVRRGIPLFNWSFFDKWDVYNLLAGTEAFRHVPESHINPSASQIKEMLDKHKFIYFKPTGGSLGIGIYRLTYNPQRGYYARFRRAGRNVLLRFSKFDSLMTMLNRQSGGLNGYVAQQGIRLIELDSCPIDFRFHMTKNSSNQWVVAAIGAKKAGKGSVTTHVRTGGMLMTPEQVLRQVFGSRADSVLSHAKEAAIKLAQDIERNYRHTLGELGFDIGIDKNERIWMFEANSKPGRSIFKHPALKEQGRASLQYIYDYCLYLSRFRARRDS
ncbi:YheC/D like ATP-grasp [Paenibacillus sp. UNCCL117]|uniref:YheC/YheD family endospore coat-associated protein n=1 Tax=unclassified Paenibacillus TaxID=185978 RepID=UPI00088F4D19|nr:MULTISPECIES: YheC/YheD family protein [unclassified Paenibacillus]SDC08181.1 YheC/D like ATP-grasp [Paenibacillus sp. cl123]SFW38203.1 YheC/D like ATP-grasp [Paenibacillus sp. UNCCL117]